MPRKTYGGISLNIPDNFNDTTTITLVHRSKEKFEGLLAVNSVSSGATMITVGRRALMDPPVPLALYAEHQAAIIRASHQKSEIIRQGSLDVETGHEAYQLEITLEHEDGTVTQSYVFIHTPAKVVVVCGSSSGSQANQRNMREYISKISSSIAV
ncbi:MAG: hypothetical protein VYC39_16105 [Myxococcota bacterium]|nr:hypothetical protein [Myxococcota bacterium]